jgi:hypothetical protein
MKVEIDEVKANQYYQAYLQTIVSNVEHHENIKYLAPEDWRSTSLMIAAVASIMVKNQDVFSELVEPNESKYKPVVTKSDALHYVSDGEMIHFIVDNSGMDWNKCCDYVRRHGIVGEEDPAFWDKDILKRPEEYNEEQVKWIGAFFEAHPWIEKFMLNFDD